MITELTQAQINAQDDALELGLAIGLATGPADRAKAEEALRDMYTKASLPIPRNIIWLPSPKAALAKIAELNNEPVKFVAPAFYGQHEINWLQYYKYMEDVVGVDCGRRLDPHWRLACQVGWCWLYADTAIITERPVELHMKQLNATLTSVGTPQRTIYQRVLHNPTGMAVKYADGTGIYALNGITVPDWLITEPYDIKRVLGITNVEVRNEGLKLGGPDVLERECNARTLHTATLANGGDYRLYEIKLNDQRRVYLRGACPSSGKQFNEAVPPDCATVEQALNWREEGTFVLPIGGYQPPVVRT